MCDPSGAIIPVGVFVAGLPLFQPMNKQIVGLVAAAGFTLLCIRFLQWFLVAEAALFTGFIGFFMVVGASLVVVSGTWTSVWLGARVAKAREPGFVATIAAIAAAALVVSWWVKFA